VAAALQITGATRGWELGVVATLWIPPTRGVEAQAGPAQAAQQAFKEYMSAFAPGGCGPEERRGRKHKWQGLRHGRSIDKLKT